MLRDTWRCWGHSCSGDPCKTRVLSRWDGRPASLVLGSKAAALHAGCWVHFHLTRTFNRIFCTLCVSRGGEVLWPTFLSQVRQLCLVVHKPFIRFLLFNRLLLVFH